MIYIYELKEEQAKALEALGIVPTEVSSDIDKVKNDDVRRREFYATTIKVAKAKYGLPVRVANVFESQFKCKNMGDVVMICKQMGRFGLLNRARNLGRTSIAWLDKIFNEFKVNY